jgi:hypothetical protein
MTNLPQDQNMLAETSMRAVVDDLDLLRALLCRHLHAVNDGFIIPCLLDLSAAVERIAKATNSAPYDTEKMAQRVEELATDRCRNFWRALDAAEVQRDHRTAFFAALNRHEIVRDLMSVDRRGGPRREGLHPMSPPKSPDIGTEVWRREQALYADKKRSRRDDIGPSRGSTLSGWAAIINDTASHVTIDALTREYQGEFVTPPLCGNCGVAVDADMSWCADCCRNERSGS